MVVTDKRIYGCVSSKKQVDLPLDQISAVALFKKNALAVSTPSGRVVFRGIGNRDDSLENRRTSDLSRPMAQRRGLARLFRRIRSAQTAETPGAVPFR